MLSEDRASHWWESEWCLGYNGLGTDISEIKFSFGHAAIGERGDFFISAGLNAITDVFKGCVLDADGCCL